MDPSTHNCLNNVIHTSNEPTFILAGVVLQFLDIDNPMTRIIAAQIRIEGSVGDLQSTYASHSGGQGGGYSAFWGLSGIRFMLGLQPPFCSLRRLAVLQIGSRIAPITAA
jgi:hypothetical protein